MSSFGKLFRVTTFGESHCKGVGVIVDGCPPGLQLTESDVQVQLTRRRPGQSKLTTPRDEKDRVTIYSGTELGYTLGTPIGMMVCNNDQRPNDYSNAIIYPRPSHADYTYLEKYTLKATSGGGRASARETIGRVAAGAIAEKYLKEAFNIEIVSFVSSVGDISMYPTKIEEYPKFWELIENVTREQVDATEVRCPDPEYAEKFRNKILETRGQHDSIGGTLVCVIRNVPAGLGEPCFDKLEAQLAQAMLSLPATKGFEIGSGFAGTAVNGHIHNDPFVMKENGKLGTTTNYSGGIQGGISNGETIYFRVAFKPVATIGQAQKTCTYDGTEGELAAKGRHDPCVVSRAVPIVETVSAIVIMDNLLIQLSRQAATSYLKKDNIPAPLVGKLPQETEAETNTEENNA